VAVVVGDRAGKDVLAPLHGVPVLVRSVRGLVASGVVGHVVVLVASAVVDEARELLVELPATVHGDLRAAAGAAHARAGGRAAVVVHDATRPLTPSALVEAVIRSVDDVHGVAVPVLPLADTVKCVKADGCVVGGPDRAGLRVVQTPQAFRPGLLTHDALCRMLAADLVEQAWAVVDGPALTVLGHPLALPVRSAWDRELAEVLVGDDA
jgi:2-C-methyl-D-erythritol 4-phosphate cytidylyltransferase